MAMSQASGTASPAPESDRLRRTSLTSRLLGRPSAGALLITVFVWIVFAILSTVAGSDVFYSVGGTLNYLDVAAQVGIVGTAVALLMIAGEFDLSIGSMIGFAGMMLAIPCLYWGWPVWLAVLFAFGCAMLLGWVNGWLVIRTGLPSFIVTLASLFILRGITLGLTRLITGRTQIPGIK